MGAFTELKGAWRVWRDRQRELSDPKAEKVDLVYTDKAGNNWYRFADPLRMPGDRALAALVATRRGDLNYTVDDERAWVRAAIGANNVNDRTMLGHYLMVKQDRLDWACEENTLRGVAQVYFLLGEEPQGVFSAEWQAKKEAIWAADEQARAFFLREAYWLTRGFSELSLTDIPNYLAIKSKAGQMLSAKKPNEKPGAKSTASTSASK